MTRAATSFGARARLVVLFTVCGCLCAPIRAHVQDADPSASAAPIQDAGPTRDPASTRAPVSTGNATQTSVDPASAVPSTDAARETAARAQAAGVTIDAVPRQEPPTPVPVPAPDPVPTPVEDPPAVTPSTPPPGATNAAPPAASTPADYTARFDASAFEREVARLVAAHPGRARRASLGTSRGGRDLVLLTLGDFASGDPDLRPAVLLVTGLDPAFEGRPAGGEPALFAARAILQRADGDPGAAAWLARTTVYVVPAPDPDLVFAEQGTQPRACRLDRNFPCAWRPWSSATCAQGPYPLSEPETRSVARFLSSRGNVGAVVLLSRGAELSTSQDAVTKDPADGDLERVLFEKLAPVGGGGGDARAAVDALARRAEAFTRESGSLAAFCRERLSAFVVPFDPFAGDVVDGPLGRAPARFASVADLLTRVADELARLTCAVGNTERLRERLWKIDLEVSNPGLLATLPEAERARSTGSVWLEATGGRIAQVGMSRGGAPQANAKQRPPAAWVLGHLDGRESLRLFVLVEAAEGTNVEFTLRTSRGAETRCAVTLH